MCLHGVCAHPEPGVCCCSIGDRDCDCGFQEFKYQPSRGTGELPAGGSGMGDRRLHTILVALRVQCHKLLLAAVGSTWDQKAQTVVLLGWDPMSPDKWMDAVEGSSLHFRVKGRDDVVFMLYFEIQYMYEVFTVYPCFG